MVTCLITCPHLPPISILFNKMPNLCKFGTFVCDENPSIAAPKFAKKSTPCQYNFIIWCVCSCQKISDTPICIKTIKRGMFSSHIIHCAILQVDPCMDFTQPSRQTAQHNTTHIKIMNYIFTPINILTMIRYRRKHFFPPNFAPYTFVIAPKCRIEW